jgi:putative transposase
MTGEIPMKKSRFSETQIMTILKQAEGGVPVPELCREHGMSNASVYKWRAKYGGMDASLIARLKKMYAERSMQNDVLKEALGKKWRGCLSVKRWPNGW